MNAAPILRSNAPRTGRLLRAACAFGLRLESGESDPARTTEWRRIAERLAEELRTGSIVLISGPSGSGKSSLIRALKTHLDTGWTPLVPAPEGSLAIVDLFDGGFDEALSDLARAGLGEAMLFGRTPGELSAGQRHRLSLALALHSIRRSGTRVLIADELVSVLDRPTAASVAGALGRAVRGEDLSLVAATAHDDIESVLNPDVVVRCALNHPPAFSQGACP